MDSPRTTADHSPFVIDVSELSRRPGTMRELTRTFTAPEGMGNAVIAVPQGAEIDVDLRLESVMEGVFISGTVEAMAIGECVRCLEEVAEDIDVDVAELYVYPERAEVAKEVGDEEEADEVYKLTDDEIDLEPLLRDAVVMALPFQPLCSPDCLGLCSECGVRLSDPGNEDHHHEILDPRWGALAGLTDAGDGKDQQDGRAGQQDGQNRQEGTDAE